MAPIDTAEGPPADHLAGVAWAAFDPAWYAARYPDVLREAPGTDPAGLHAHYLARGRHAAHSPNPFFDEAFYRQRNPDVVASLGEHQWQSGFEHYCLMGHREARPVHWLFEEPVYRAALGAEMTDAALRAAGFANAYDHYLREGSRAGLVASPFLDPAYLLSRLPPDDAAAAAASGAFAHVVTLLAREGATLRTSPSFDPDWYLIRYPEVAAEIAAGRWQSALHHYLANPTPAAFDPLHFFSEAHYLATYPDIATAVEAGHVASGYRHFLAHGAAELRSPAPMIDLAGFLAANPSVAADIAAGRERSAFHAMLRSNAGGGRHGEVDALRGLSVLFVLGMHRSGTSFLARQLVQAGFYVPGTPMEGDGGTEGGFFESLDVAALNEAALRTAGGGWHVFLRPRLDDERQVGERLATEAAQLLATILRPAGTAVIKDPRLCLTLPYWLRACERLGLSARLLVIVRDPADVATSLARRNQLSTAHARLLWARYNHDLAQAIRQAGRRPEAVLRYETLDRDLRRLAAALELPEIAAQAESFARANAAKAEPGPGPEELDRLAAGMADPDGFLAAEPGLAALLAPVEAQAEILAPLLDPARRFSV
jgi:hypothetical protein